MTLEFTYIPEKPNTLSFKEVKIISENTSKWSVAEGTTGGIALSRMIKEGEETVQCTFMDTKTQQEYSCECKVIYDHSLHTIKYRLQDFVAASAARHPDPQRDSQQQCHTGGGKYQSPGVCNGLLPESHPVDDVTALGG